jgi:flagellar biosynthesis/type III secretory pathway chaperone
MMQGHSHYAPSNSPAPRPSARPVPPAALEALSDALASEHKLIDELTAVMLQQRNAVGVDDLQAVDDSVFATHRLLLTLGEARKRRRAINRMLGYDEELGVRQLGDVLGAQMTPRLRTERDELQDAARRLSKEIEINRRILREALSHSETFVRAMRGTPAEKTQVYGTNGTTATTAGYAAPGTTSFTRTA